MLLKLFVCRRWSGHETLVHSMARAARGVETRRSTAGGGKQSDSSTSSERGHFVGDASQSASLLRCSSRSYTDWKAFASPSPVWARGLLSRERHHLISARVATLRQWEHVESIRSFSSPPSCAELCTRMGSFERPRLMRASASRPRSSREPDSQPSPSTGSLAALLSALVNSAKPHTRARPCRPSTTRTTRTRTEARGGRPRRRLERQAHPIRGSHKELVSTLFVLCSSPREQRLRSRSGPSRPRWNMQATSADVESSAATGLTCPISDAPTA